MLLIPHQLPHIHNIFWAAHSKLAVRHGADCCDAAVWNLTNTLRHYTHTQTHVRVMHNSLFLCFSSPACAKPRRCAATSPANQTCNQRDTNRRSERSTALWPGPSVGEDSLSRKQTIQRWGQFCLETGDQAFKKVLQLITAQQSPSWFLYCNVFVTETEAEYTVLLVVHVQLRNEQSSDTVRNSGTPRLRTTPWIVPLWPRKLLKCCICT